MISKTMEETLNQQINAELHSSYIYLSMSAYFESVNLRGFANWMRVQAQEELVHVCKFYNYLVERDGRVLLDAIDAPPTKWDSPLDTFEAAFKHEQKISGKINDLMDLALKEKDHATANFLQFFISEQVEEEATAKGVVDQLKMIGDAKAGLFMMDRELGARTFAPEA